MNNLDINLRSGNMWEHTGEYDLILVTSNANLNQHGELVMGAGAAKHVRDNYPGLAKTFGNHVRGHELYGILTIGKAQRFKEEIGLFQTKINWLEKSNVGVIAYSCGMLTAIAREERVHQRICLNFPGIGYGGLHPKDVLPYVQMLPENVDLWVMPTHLYLFKEWIEHDPGGTLLT